MSLRGFLCLLAAVLLCWPGFALADDDDDEEREVSERWLEIRPDFEDFGILVPERSESAEFTAVNRGPVNLYLKIPEVRGGEGAFRISENSCGGLLKRKKECRFRVEFRPPAPGEYRGRVVVGTPWFEREAQLRGEGALPVLAAEPGDVDFGRIEVGASEEKTVALRNPGPGTVRIEHTALPQPPFFLKETCSGIDLRAGEACQFRVRFSPDGEGIFRSGVRVFSDAGETTIALQGEGGRRTPDPLDPPDPSDPSDPPDPPELGVSDPLGAPGDGILPFGEVAVGGTARASVTVTAGDSELLLERIGTADPLEPPFEVVEDGCSERPLAAGASCVFEVLFRPESPEVFEDTFIVAERGGAASLTLRVSGRGVTAAGNRPPGAPALIHPEPGQANLEESVTFRWSPAGDPDGDPLRYELYCSKDPDFAQTRPLLSGWVRTAALAGFGLAGLAGFLGRGRPGWRRFLLTAVAGTLLLLGACGGDTELNRTATLSDLDPQATYYWKIVADDGRGGRAQSEVRSFSTR